ncbi:pyroglutamyl-peptidase [Arthrobacter sp. CAN_A212]|uniref:pyroglutamyl-peptidase I n=1 Tax=unclassified Arthrobacter TaxID=235627 RepID=UPI0018CAD5C9|nr:pyroglutamyl-peptidase I [Arthrobacter sp. CAN_C5]MBP2217492.1 pyroglutamyl-peptidase [Arthrobacter sp. CAN_C5]
MILFTGFEPFGGEALNPSWLAAQEAAAALRAVGSAAVAVELPCTFGESLTRLREAVSEHRPGLVLCVGQAGGRARISLERVAINVDDARIPDNAGNQPVDSPIRPGGPAAYFSTLPIKQALQDLTVAGIAAEVSQTAGTYVCNHVFYGLMDLLSASGDGTRGGFIHVPYTPDQAAVHGAPGMPVAEMADALVLIAQTSQTTTSDLRLAAGAEH